jgi:hypothetical protein
MTIPSQRYFSYVNGHFKQILKEKLVQPAFLSRGSAVVLHRTLVFTHGDRFLAFQPSLYVPDHTSIFTNSYPLSLSLFKKIPKEDVLNGSLELYLPVPCSSLRAEATDQAELFVYAVPSDWSGDPSSPPFTRCILSVPNSVKAELAFRGTHVSPSNIFIPFYVKITAPPKVMLSTFPKCFHEFIIIE